LTPKIVFINSLLHPIDLSQMLSLNWGSCRNLIHFNSLWLHKISPKVCTILCHMFYMKFSLNFIQSTVFSVWYHLWVRCNICTEYFVFLNHFGWVLECGNQLVIKRLCHFSFPCRYICLFHVHTMHMEVFVCDEIYYWNVLINRNSQAS